MHRNMYSFPLVVFPYFITIFLYFHASQEADLPYFQRTNISVSEKFVGIQ